MALMHLHSPLHRTAVTLLLTLATLTTSLRPPQPPSCAIFCQGNILAALQNHFIFGNDSKTFVDSPLRNDPLTVRDAFDALPRPLTTAALQHFSSQHFDLVGSDLIDWTPPDWKPVPPLLAAPAIAKNATLRNFTLGLNQLWLQLGRQATADVALNPQRHTLLATKHPLVVPGGRFRESYYWDSYWIVKGLLHSGMNNTAAGVVDNFVDFIDRFGFVPNGGRTYYLTRSQPPLLSEMVRVLFEQGGRNAGALPKYIQALELEHAFWMLQRSFHHTAEWHRGITPGTRGTTLPPTCNLRKAKLVLNHYDANTTLPRPESFREDSVLAAAAIQHGRNASQLLRDIAAAAESGWDFSSRWFGDHATLATVRTSFIVPVELNTILVRMEYNMCNMMLKVDGSGDTDDQNQNQNKNRHKGYCDLARQRWTAMQDCMWNETSSRWNDLLVDTDGTVSQIVDAGASIANWIPLWGAYLMSTNSTRVVNAVLSLRER